MANQVTIDIEARFVDNVSGQTKAASKSFDDLEKNAREAAKEVDKLGKKKAEPKVDANTSPALDKLNRTEAKLKKLGNKKTNLLVTLKDRASQLLDKVANKAKAIGGKTYSFLVKMRDSDALRSLNKISNAGQKIAGKTWSAAVKIKDLATAPLRGIKNMLFSIKSLVLAITAGFAAKQLILNPINVADAYSSAKISFSTLLGESQGQQMMDNLDQFAKATPFNTTNVISNAQKMLAMGWNAEDIIGDMEVIGNAAAATGKLDQGLESIVRAMSQIKTKGRLSTEELNQLAEAGIAAKAMLAEQLGYGTGDTGIAKMTEDLEEGKIASDKAIAALLAGMRKYDGMMDSMANETVEGLGSQIKDAFDINVVRKWGQGLQDGAKRGFGTVVDLLDKSEDALAEFGDMMYDIGHKASNWVADKFQNAVDRILKITDTFEFQNASLGEKISMLWKGVVADPLKEWWEGGGQQKTAETAGKIGEWMGKTITDGLLAIFGVTDILDPEKADELGKNGGMSIAQSFAKGFKENFDGSAITDAFVDAISNVWGALPTWAKFLIGGYAAGKVAGGIGNLAGSITSAIDIGKSIIGSSGTVAAGGNVVGAAGLLGLIGKTGVAGVGATGILGTMANTGYALMGGTSALAMTGGQAAMIGGGSIAGGLAVGAGLIHAGKTGYSAYQGFKEGDKTKGWANVARSGGTLAGMGAGAAIGAKAGTAIGAMFGGVGAIPGALIGAGLGTLVGWFAGDKIAKNIEAAKYESEEMQEAIKDADISSEELAATWEKAVWQRSRDIFGDIELSAAEIATMSKQIVLGDKVKAMDEFASAASQAEASMQSLQNSTTALDRWNWKAGLGLALTDDEQKSYKAAIDSFVNDAQSYLESKQYEFTAAVKLLMDTGEGSAGANIIAGNDAFYAGLREQVAGYSTQLQELVGSALENGSLGDEIEITIDGENFTVDEQSAIEMLQQKIADITNSINAAGEKAQLDMIEIKFKKSGISYESYEELQAGIDAYMETALSNLDEAQLAVLTSLNLQLDKATTPEEKANIEAQIEQALESYGISVDELHANVNDFILDLAADNFSSKDLLGDDALAKINDVLSQAVKEGIKPGELTGDDITRMLGLENFDAEAAEVLANILNNLDFESALKPDPVETTVGVNITGEKNIQNTIDVLVEDFGIPKEQADTVALLLTGDKEILSKIDTSALASELGVPESVAQDIITKLSGTKSIEERVTVLGTDLVSATEVWQTITVNLKARLGQVVDKVSGFFGGGSGGGKGSGYRGGIFGGESAMDAFARGGSTDNGGIVGGSTRFIRVNEESPEMIIPLSSQRRERALKLWMKTGEMLDVPGFARGGRSNGGNDEGIRFMHNGSDSSAGSREINITFGDINFTIQASGGDKESIVAAIREQAGELADYVIGVVADGLAVEFENTPVRGGVA